MNRRQIEDAIDQCEQEMDECYANIASLEQEIELEKQDIAILIDEIARLDRLNDS